MAMYRKLGFLGKSQERWENMVRNEERRVMRTLTATVGTVGVITSVTKWRKVALITCRSWSSSEFGGTNICCFTLMIVVTTIY